jgi:hypothetical protein
MVEKKIDTEAEERSKTIVITFRVFQAICFGIFALGLSMGLGDYGKFVNLPFSQISITTTVFGLIGSIITGILSKNAEKW